MFVVLAKDGIELQSDNVRNSSLPVRQMQQFRSELFMLVLGGGRTMFLLPSIRMSQHVSFFKDE